MPLPTAAPNKANRCQELEALTPSTKKGSTMNLSLVQESKPAGPEQPLPYSFFTVRQKRTIIFLVAFAGMFSPLSSFIYYPALSSMTKDLRVSLEKMNLTITSYMIVSSVTPTLVGDTADQVGRRMVYIVTLSVYLIANIGLALQTHYAGLLVLRMLQSVGSSGTISLAYGVVSDIATPAERGSYVGLVLLGPNVAPNLGPVLGGILVQFAGWRWIFWTLSILTAATLAIIIILLPETARNIVGNGSLVSTGISRNPISFIRSGQTEGRKPAKRVRCHVPSLLPSLSLIIEKDTAIILFINGIFYTLYCCIQASLSSLFIAIYGFTALEAGLIYLPFGFGCLLMSYFSGRIMNRDYKLVAKKVGIEVDEIHGDDIYGFPIEKARLRSMGYLIVVTTLSLVGYGWALKTSAHVSIPLVLQFLVGGAITGIFNMCGTLLIDVHPKCPSSASACANLIRCTLSAIGLAILDFIIDGLGVGWAFTLFAAISLSTTVLVWAEWTWGMKWRRSRDANITEVTAATAH